MPYYSDSNMRHPVETFEEAICGDKYSELHLLFHPLNWVAGGKDMSEILSQTWGYVIREREEDFSLNSSYQKLFPKRMSEEVVQSFIEQCLRAAQGGPKEGN